MLLVDGVAQQFGIPAPGRGINQLLIIASRNQPGLDCTVSIDVSFPKAQMPCADTGRGSGGLAVQCPLGIAKRRVSMAATISNKPVADKAISFTTDHRKNPNKPRKLEEAHRPIMIIEHLLGVQISRLACLRS